MVTTRKFTRERERLGPLPLLNHFLDRLGVERILERFLLGSLAPRSKVPAVKALGVLLRSIVVEREPVYRQQEMVLAFSPRVFGLSQKQTEALRDDAVGRALDRLFAADRGAFVTACSVAAQKEFKVSLSELHNDSTSVRFCGQYVGAKGRSIRGKKAPWITYGYSKDHRRDLKQLLLTLTATRDGMVPVHVRCDDGNTSDSTTHLETWETLRALHGSEKFLYVADSKLCNEESMETIDSRGGRFVTVLPRSRREDKLFREWIQTHDPPWEKVRDRPNPRRKYGPRDVWKVYKQKAPSRENWPIIWIYSTLLRQRQGQRRQERIARALQEIEALEEKLRGPRPRLRSQPQIEERLWKIVTRLRVRNYVRAWVVPLEIPRFRQERRGRPGPDTRYLRSIQRRFTIGFEVDQETIEYDKRSDGMYPALTNDKSLSLRAVFEAHKGQAGIERRFRQTKAVHEIAPVFLKNEGRIVALFTLYFVALLVEALIEREIRNSMKASGIKALPLYPEERESSLPTANTIFRIFSFVDRETVFEDGRTVANFEPELTDLQKQILNLLGVPLSAYIPG
jgi:transposase